MIRWYGKAWTSQNHQLEIIIEITSPFPGDSAAMTFLSPVTFTTFPKGSQNSPSYATSRIARLENVVFLLKHVSNHPVVSHALFVVDSWLFSWPSFFLVQVQRQLLDKLSQSEANGVFSLIVWRFFRKNGIVIVGSRCKSLVAPTTKAWFVGFIGLSY